jgi:acylpyruvate hydrolase
MTARNAQDEAKKKGLPWSVAKGFDTFLPLGRPVAKSIVPDPHNAELFLSINGKMRQDASTNLMLFRIPRILAAASSVMTLIPGDIVLTGTPAGVGSVSPGDVLRAGLRVGGNEITDAAIEVGVEDANGVYSFKET